jgi:hypothetical protein
LESLSDWEEIKRKKQAIKLLKEIRNIIFNFWEQSYPMHSSLKANEAAYLIRQKEDEADVKFYERLCKTIETDESYGASFGLNGNSYELDEKYSELTEEEK